MPRRPEGSPSPGGREGGREGRRGAACVFVCGCHWRRGLNSVSGNLTQPSQDTAFPPPSPSLSLPSLSPPPLPSPPSPPWRRLGRLMSCKVGHLQGRPPPPPPPPRLVIPYRLFFLSSSCFLPLLPFSCPGIGFRGEGQGGRRERGHHTLHWVVTSAH